LIWLRAIPLFGTTKSPGGGKLLPVTMLRWRPSERHDPSDTVRFRRVGKRRAARGTSEGYKVFKEQQDDCTKVVLKTQ
jgi:hypothetical protein